MKKNEKGFNVIEGMLIFVIVAILAGTGWYVWDSNKKTNTLLNSADKNSSSIVKQPSQNQISTDAKKTTQYLDIKEWKIKLPLSNQISDAYYVMSTSSQGSEQPDTIWLGVKSIDSVMECSAANANNGGSPLAGLVKVSTTQADPVSGEGYQKKYPDGTTINNFYYGYSDWISKNPCTKDINYKAKLMSINAAFINAAQNIISE
jgi:hypothetical protein